MRYKAKVSYDGTDFNGWQIQPEGRTVQKAVQDALFKLCQTEIPVTAAGRTDAGVHALGQIFHFDCDKQFKDIKTAINSQLPEDVRIIECEPVDDEFHSRYDAKWKYYSYMVNTGEYNPLQRNYVYQLGEELDVEAMRDASYLFLGKHDFTSFNATKKDEMENQVRTIDQLDISEHNNVVSFDFVGDGFLRHMIRMMVGTLIEVGRGRITEEEVKNMLEACDKDAVHYNAPACGLYLVQISYEVF